MFILQWFASKGFRFRLLSLLVFIAIPIFILVQAFILPTFKEKILEGKKDRPGSNGETVWQSAASGRAQGS